MDTTSLPIFLVYFAEGKCLVLFDPVDRTCGSENQIISMILAGFGARTPTKHSTLQVLSSEITNWNNSKILISGRNTEGIDGNHEYSNSFGNFIYLFLPVEPNLDKVAKTQFVLFNQTSSLWCPAQGAPAPFIVWRKNGIMVQNSTSIKYQLTITEENNDKYSCEVKKQDDLDKEEIRLVIESEFFSQTN